MRGCATLAVEASRLASMCGAVLLAAGAARAQEQIGVADLSTTVTAWTQERIVVADFSTTVTAAGTPEGWELKEKTGKADFAVVTDDGVPAARFRSERTSYSIQKKVRIDLAQFPVLAWRWKVTQLPPGGDFRRTRTDDQAAQLFVAFTKTKAIVYIWDTTAPEGLMVDTTPAPFLTVKVVVVRSGPADTGKWMCETRNVRDDYLKLYGSEPPLVSGIRLQINTQHTKTSAESYFAEVAFEK
jgi:hypothetical protein